MKKDDYYALLAQTKKLNILYVEDNKDVREQTLKMLQNYFSNIDLAVDGKDGLIQFEKKAYDIVFTDIEMPKMNGISMLEEIKKRSTHTLFVIFSAHSHTDYFLKSIQVGIDGYIIKPFNLVQIEKLINELVEKLNMLEKRKNSIYLHHGYHYDGEMLYDKEGTQIKLSKNEKLLFKLLSSSKNGVFSAIDIENYIFEDIETDNKRIRNLIYRLRSKLDADLVESVYNLGYKLKMR